MTLEKDWQRDIIRLARTLGWKVAHFRPAQTTKGWRTPVGADGAGFPDLILVRDRLIAVELKNEKGRVTEEQLEWIAALEVAGIEAYVWRPDDLDDVMKVLLERRQPFIELPKLTDEEAAKLKAEWVRKHTGQRPRPPLDARGIQLDATVGKADLR